MYIQENIRIIAVSILLSTQLTAPFFSVERILIVFKRPYLFMKLWNSRKDRQGTDWVRNIGNTRKESRTLMMMLRC